MHKRSPKVERALAKWRKQKKNSKYANDPEFVDALRATLMAAEAQGGGVSDDYLKEDKPTSQGGKRRLPQRRGR